MPEVYQSHKTCKVQLINGPMAVPEIGDGDVFSPVRHAYGHVALLGAQRVHKEAEDHDHRGDNGNYPAYLKHPPMELRCVSRVCAGSKQNGRLLVPELSEFVRN